MPSHQLGWRGLEQVVNGRAVCCLLGACCHCWGCLCFPRAPMQVLQGGRQKLLWGRTTAKTSVRAMKVEETRHNRESRGSGTLLKSEKQQLCPVWSQGLVVREAKLPGSGAWARYVFTPLAPVHVVLHWLL